MWNETFKMYGEQVDLILLRLNRFGFVVCSEVPFAYASAEKQLDLVVQVWTTGYYAGTFLGQKAFIVDSFADRQVKDEWHERINFVSLCII